MLKKKPDTPVQVSSDSDMDSVDDLLVTSDEDISEKKEERKRERDKEIEKREKMKKGNSVMPSASVFLQKKIMRAKAAEKEKKKRGKTTGAKK